MNSDTIKTKDEAMSLFDSFAKRTNFFDNDIAQANLRIFIGEIWESGVRAGEGYEKMSREIDNSKIH